jgi:hypothetical protein
VLGVDNSKHFINFSLLVRSLFFVVETLEKGTLEIEVNKFSQVMATDLKEAYEEYDLSLYNLECKYGEQWM